ARVRRELAARGEFARLNLLDRDWPVDAAFDAIFCRNVMIYFDKPTQARLIERFSALLKPQGLFFAGHAESLLDNGRHFRLRGQTVYELANRTPTQPSPRREGAHDDAR
ncbi:MAG TPA: CheR family methyltransferase, partial [Usitatibacter sp.]|nr:CheR family methyltransferase [Usitatibacter sp.]